MATQLGLYNAAIRHLGARRLASLTEDQQARYALDDAYSDALVFCLRQGTWNFALEENSIAAASAGANSVAYSNRFTKPADWVRTKDVSSSATFEPPLTDFADMAGYWYAGSSVLTLYVRFVSSTPGIVPANFPNDYAEYVSAYLAWLIYPEVTGGGPDARAVLYETVVAPAHRAALANDALDGKPSTQKVKMLSEITAIDNLIRPGGKSAEGGV